MMGPTHAFIAMIPAVILFWKNKESYHLFHGRFLLFALYCGLIPDLDYISGMLELVFTNNIPASFSQFLSIGRQNHPLFTHHVFTMAIGFIAVLIGVIAHYKFHHAHLEPKDIKILKEKRKKNKYIPLLMVVTVSIPLLFLRLGSYSFSAGHVIDASLWNFNLTITLIFLSGLVFSIFLNLRRPLYLIVFGLGIYLHVLCDFIQYWIIVIGPFDPAWTSSAVPMYLGLGLYGESDIILGTFIEGPFIMFFIGYLFWYFFKGKSKIKRFQR
ncbi:MAG: hypothetical protein ACTSYS_06480 [Promethearchaeota archaeon]